MSTIMSTIAIKPIASGISDFGVRQEPNVQDRMMGYFPLTSTPWFKVWVAFLFTQWHLTEEPVVSVTIAQDDLPAGEPYRFMQPISGIVRRVGTDWVAEIPAANIGTSGETRNIAFTNLILDLLDTFDYLSDNANRLGPEPARQLNYLRTFLAKIDH